MAHSTRIVALLSLGACHDPPPLILNTITDGGTWKVSLGDGEYDQGFPTLLLRVEPAREPLEVGLTASMPSMGHTSPWASFYESAQGRYEGEVELGMPGLWQLEGEIAGDLSEAFVLRISVR